MANVDSNMDTFYQSLPDRECLYSGMHDALSQLDFSNMEAYSRSLITEYCDETRAGLCHCLHFIGDSLVTFADNNVKEFTPESLCQLGHGLNAISLLIPALADMAKQATNQPNNALSQA